MNIVQEESLRDRKKNERRELLIARRIACRDQRFGDQQCNWLADVTLRESNANQMGSEGQTAASLARRLRAPVAKARER